MFVKQENKQINTQLAVTDKYIESNLTSGVAHGDIFIIKTVIQEEFDETFYRNHAKITSEDDALTHFLNTGWKEGLDPCDWFSVNGYLELNSDLKDYLLNPFFHYLATGKYENRPIRESQHKPIVLDPKIDELAKIIDKEFDEQYYRSSYNIPATINAVHHYLEKGWKLGHNPNIWFLIEEYLENNPDILKSGIEPFSHYLRHGINENRRLYNIVIPKTATDNLPSSQVIHSFTHFSIYNVASKLRESAALTARCWVNWTSKLDLINSAPEHVQAHMDNAVIFAQGKEGVIVGWLVSNGNPMVWAEDAEGHIWFLDDAYRTKRKDVRDAFLNSNFKCISEDLGFVLRLSNTSPVGGITLKTLSHQGVHILARKEFENKGSSSIQAAQWLFGVPTDVSSLAERFTKLDSLIIETVLAEERKQYTYLNTVIKQYGHCPTSPTFSVIIPLYGRLDFIESQLMCFSSDEHIIENAEIIYVLDDPKLINELATTAEQLFNLYQIPFKTVLGGINRGFSGANNLGAEYANGELLLFLNSDVFPKRDGWLELLQQELLRSPSTGVVAPRLTFADGSIQHAGIMFKKRTDLGIWINHHPQMGLSPELDSNKTPTALPAVTGACMLIRRSDFDAINGWDMGYLIGDFEDSDLCLKLRKIGKDCLYIPDVELTHLERQSFQLTGAGDFRMKVVILNAVRHQERWANLLAHMQNEKWN